MVYKRLRDLREDHDLSQEAIAKYLNMTQRAYSYYETGDREVPIEVLSKLSTLYQTSIDYLVNRTDKK